MPPAYPTEKVAARVGPSVAPVQLPLVDRVKFSEVGKRKLLDFWHGVGENTGLQICRRERLTGIERNGDGSVVPTDRTRHTSRSVPVWHAIGTMLVGRGPSSTHNRSMVGHTGAPNRRCCIVVNERGMILLLGRLPSSLEARLAATYPLMRVADPQAVPAGDGLVLDEVVAVVTSARTGINAAWIERLPALRVISSLGVGLERLDLAAARARGIAVGYTPGLLDDCVADLALGLMLDVARSISAADRFVRAGRWPAQPYALTRRMSGKRLGILGLGRIGRAIARRAQAFDMPVSYTNRRPLDQVPYRYVSDLRELAEQSDFLVVAASASSGTAPLVTAEVLQALGPAGYLVNIARGSLVDEAALIEALRSGRIAGAGLDVHAHEPSVPEALWGLDNVVLLPHIGASTRESIQAMTQRVLDNLDAFHTTGRVLSDALAQT
jgi:hydroxypyruvate reductase